MNGLIAKTIVEDDLEWAQNALPWCFRQELPDGRVLGDNRDVPTIDRRLEMLASRIPLNGATVLEPGCCEGNITLGLCMMGAKVHAFDARLPNVVKTFTRLALADHWPIVFQHDARDMSAFQWFDVVMHCGLLYHLADPVTHLGQLAKITDTLLLDTHVAYREDEGDETGHWWDEAQDLWSGMQAQSFWLRENYLLKTARDVGFTRIEKLDWLEDANQCGPRGVWLLTKT